MESKPSITDFSHELLCQILKYLPLREILSVAMLCKKMLSAVDMHLKLCKSIDFCQNAVCGYMPSTITDDHLLTLLKKCPHLETVYGLHPVKIERRRLRKRSALTIPGIIEALSLCFHLKAIETSDLRLFEAIMQHLPQLEIIGHFQNRDGLFPPQASQRLKLQPYPRISSLHLIGVEVPELTAMPHLQHLHLQCVRFTKLQPFRAFLAQNLKSFVMKHCIGPSVPQRYLSLIIALSSSPNLSHLELVRVPLLNGLFQRAVEDSYRHNGFVNLRTLVISGCKGILEADLGHLMIVASKNLETLYIQPSLTKDSLFVSLSFAQCSFPRLQNLHLGYIDNLNSPGEWSNDALLSFGLAEVPDTPSSITDSGMKVISQLFPLIKTLSVSNCPHLMIMYQWMSGEDLEAWSKLTDLTLQKCHCLQLSSFALFISVLPNIQVVILNDMFREPPKGCSHVGLSAGTGLGMSSAVVSNQDEHIAVQGHQQDFEHPGDEENEENEREFIDVENDDNPEPHFMVLQRDFFDGENDDGGDADAPIEEGQDPSILEREHNEEHDVAEYQPDNNSLSNNKHALTEKNSDTSKCSSMDKNNNGPSTSSASSDQNIFENESKYHLRQAHKKLPSSKSLHVQNDCFKEKDSFNSEEVFDVKVIPENIDSDVLEYDPHKPSTSKAGRHLDYSCDTMSDSENMCDFKYSANIKRLRTSSNKQSVSKKVKNSELTNLSENSLSEANCSLENVNEDDHAAKTEKVIHYNRSVKNDISDSYSYSNEFNSSSNENCKLVRSCNVLITKYEKEICGEASNSSLMDFCAESETEINSFSKANVITTVTSDNSFSEGKKISNDSDVLNNTCVSKELHVDIGNRDSLDRDKKKSLKYSEFENCVHNVTKDEASNASVDDKYLSRDMLSYGPVEKLEIKTHSIGRNIRTENEEKSEDRILEYNDMCLSEDKYNNGNHRIKSEDTLVNSHNDCIQINKNLSVHIIQEDISREDKCFKVDECSDSFVKIEDENSCVNDNCFDLISASTESKNLDICLGITDNTQVNESAVYTLASKCKDEIHLSCSEITEDSLQSAKKINNVCASSTSENLLTDSFSQCFNETEHTINNYNQDTRLKYVVKLNNDSCNASHNQKDMCTSTVEKSSKSEAVVVSVNSDSLCVSSNIEPKNLDNIAENKRETSKSSTPVFSCSGSSIVNDLSKIKPCCVLVTKIDNMPEFKQKTALDSNFEFVSYDCHNFSVRSENENLKIHDACQPSTSKVGTGIHNEYSRKCSRSLKRTRSLKNETSTICTKNKRVNSDTHIENQVRDGSESEKQNEKKKSGDENHTDDSSKSDLDPSPPRRKRLKKTSKELHCDEFNYYALLSSYSSGSVEIVNSSTGESYRTPSCHIFITHINSENCNALNLQSKLKANHKKCSTSSELNAKQSELSSESNQHLNFTARAKNNIDNVLETPNYNVTSVNHLSYRYPISDKGVKEKSTYVMKSKKQTKESNKYSSNGIKDEMVDNSGCSKSEKTETCNKNSSTISEVGTERLKIRDSDAAVLIKRCTEKNNKFNSCTKPECHRSSNNPVNIENNFNNSYTDERVKEELDTRMSSVSESHSLLCPKHNDTVSNNKDSSPCERSTAKSSSCSDKRTRRKNITKSQKQGKPFKNSSVKSNCSCRHSVRNNSKKHQSVPMISLISQGTQATSADIRRSVRRIRRATARARKTISSLRISKNSSHSSKISAKILTKRPVNTNSRPESHDKATSTSDPLLEDDAVQTLQLASETLLSFTVVSCGISDLIIDRCPKLFHIEVQACRILKKFQLNFCPAMKRLNVSQCPKLNICALATPVMSLTTDSHLLVSYEPCMQGYHPGHGEKAVFSKAAINQSVLLCHDFSDISHDGMQAKFKEKLLDWLRFLSKFYLVLNCIPEKPKRNKRKSEISQCSEYPWSHDLRRIHGHYAYSPSSDFCLTEGRYQVITNNPIFCDIFETSQEDTGFSDISDCEAYKNNSLISYETIKKYILMQKKFVGFYIPVTESNQINF